MSSVKTNYINVTEFSSSHIALFLLTKLKFFEFLCVRYHFRLDSKEPRVSVCVGRLGMLQHDKHAVPTQTELV